MFNKDLNDIHWNILEDLVSNGDSYTQDELITIKDRVDNDYQTIRAFCGTNHIELIQSIFLKIAQLQRLQKDD